MKKSEIRAIVYSILFVITMLLIPAVSHAQSSIATPTKNFYRVSKPYDDVKIPTQFNIYVNDKKVDNIAYSLHFMNKSKGIDVTKNIGSEFTIFLDYNEEYSFTIGSKNYNKKTIDISTASAPIKNWLLECNIYLYDDEPDEFAGKLVYSEMDKKFKKI